MMNINPFVYLEPISTKTQTIKNNVEFDQLLFENIQVEYDQEYIEEMIYLRKSQIHHGFINIMPINYENGQESLIDLKLNNAVFRNINKTRMNDNDIGGIFNFMNYKNIQLINVTVENCHSPNAIIKIMKGDTVVIKNSKILNNAVSYQGGGIINIKISNNIIIRQSSFISNNSTEGGAVHSEFIKYFRIQDCFFEDNQANVGNGGAINAIHAKLIYIKSTVFESNRAAKAGGSLFIKSSQYLGCVGLVNITAQNTKFSGEINAQHGGFAAILETHTLIINDTLVNGFNSEITGGGLYLSEISNLTLTSTIISNSYSSLYAGAAFLNRIGKNINGQDMYTTRIAMIVQNCLSYFGGGLFIQNVDEILDLSKVTFLSNYAHIEGNDSIQNFQSLGVVSIQESNSNIRSSLKNIPFEQSPIDMSVQLLDFRSGSKVMFEFYVLANFIDNKLITMNQNIQQFSQADEYESSYFGIYEMINHKQKLDIQRSKNEDTNEIVNDKIKKRDISTFLTIQKEDEHEASHLVSLLSEADMQSTHLAYSSYFIKGTEKKKLRFSLQLRKPYYEESIFDDNFKVQINIDFRECIQGEFRMNYQAEICYQCPFSTFSFEKPTNLTTCKNKPMGVNSSFGNYWDLEVGYWRSEERPEILIECSNLKENCKGGDQFNNFLCSEGHIGPLCEECDNSKQFWNETYAKTGLYSCTKCRDIQSNKLVIIGVLFALFSLLIIILFSTYKKVTNNIYRYYLTKMRICYIGNSYYKMTLSTAYLKIFLNFLQTIQMSQLIRFKDFRDILFISNVIGQPLQTVFFSVDCWLSEYLKTKKQLTEIKILFVILAPLIYLLVVGGFSFLAYKYKKGRNISKLKYITNTAIIYGLINIFNISCFRILVNTLFCRQIGHQLYLKIDLTIQCDNNQDLVAKQLFLYLPACIFWSFIVPSIIFYGLFRKRQQLNTISTRYMYGFLYNEYKSNFYYWDFIRMVKNIVLIIFANHYQNSRIWIFCLISIVISQIYTVSLIVYRPFNTQHLNKSEVQSSILTAITFFSSLMMSLQENVSSFRYRSDNIDNLPVHQFGFNDQNDIVYFVGLFVTLLICVFSIKTIFNIFISFFERRLFFKKIMACLFNRPITFRRFVNIQKMRKLFEGIAQFSKTESKTKYNDSLQNFMIKNKKEINCFSHLREQNSTTIMKQILEQHSLRIDPEIYNSNALNMEKSSNQIEMSNNLDGNIKVAKKNQSIFGIFRNLSNRSSHIINVGNTKVNQNSLDALLIQDDDDKKYQNNQN